MKIIVAGIHTGIGKTISSTVLCEALKADYWKPVQAGDLHQSDSMFVAKNTSIRTIHPERFRLTVPASPHYASAVDGIEIKLNDFQIPHTEHNLIIETAGGIMSPLSTKILNIDFIQYLNLPVVLVSENYLGSINHTLLTIELLKSKKIEVMGIIFNGDENVESEKFITQYSALNKLFSIPKFENISKQSIAEFVTKQGENISRAILES
jgi:dethiobiotin synthetase